MGRQETGASAALPMWVDFMRVALADMPEATMERPPGLVTVRIDPRTGLLAGADHPGAVFESFSAGHPRAATPRPPLAIRWHTGGPRNTPVAPDQLF